jgi:hypothetical protein
MANSQRKTYQPKLFNIEHIFPVLKPSLIDRITSYGRIQSVQPGDVLITPGTKNVSFLIVNSGERELVQSPWEWVIDALIAITFLL